MPEWVAPLAAGSLTVLLLNVAWLVQRAHQRSKEWPARFLAELHRWDGRLPTGPDRTPRP